MSLDEILSDLYLRLHTADEARDLIDGIMWREINAHVAAERDACAEICKAEAKRLAESADRLELGGYDDESGPVRAMAWRCVLLKERIEDRGKI